jgi:hypothetical protein
MGLPLSSTIADARRRRTCPSGLCARQSSPARRRKTRLPSADSRRSSKRVQVRATGRPQARVLQRQAEGLLGVGLQYAEACGGEGAVCGSAAPTAAARARRPDRARRENAMTPVGTPASSARGVIWNDSMRAAPVASSHTVCQMPLTLVYQSGTCLPSGRFRVSVWSSTRTTTVFRAVKAHLGRDIEAETRSSRPRVRRLGRR